MQQSAEHTDKVKLEKQRALRRKRILENAQNRLEKLKNSQWRHSQEEKAPQRESNSVQLASKVDADDPPDEILTPVVRVRPSTTAVTQPLPAVQEQKVSLLHHAVTAIQADVSVKARLTTALMCGLLMTLCSVSLGTAGSFVLVMSLVNCSLYVVLSIAVTPDPATNPLAWLELVKLPLSFLHYLLPVLFEYVCLSVYLLVYFVQDVLVMLFSAVVCLSLANLLPL